MAEKTVEELFLQRPWRNTMRNHQAQDAADLRSDFFITKGRGVPEVNLLGGMPLSINCFLSHLSVILGIPGCGKSNTNAALSEELLHYKVRMSIIDTEGEYFPLKEMFPFLRIVGDTRRAEKQFPEYIEGHRDNIEWMARDLAREVIHKQQSIILDVSRTGDEARWTFLRTYLNTLYDECEELYFKQKQAVHVIVIEEADRFIPLRPYAPTEEGRFLLGSLKAAARAIAAQGRKRGLGVVLATQRNQFIDRGVTAMADLRLLHKATEVNDLKLYADLLGSNFTNVKKVAPDLKPGEVMFRYGETKGIFKVRLRYSFHPARTPDYSDVKRNDELMREHGEI